MSDKRQTTCWATTWAYRKAQSAVSSLLNSPNKLIGLLDKAIQKSDAHASGALIKTIDSIKVLVRLAASYARGDYRAIPTDKLIMILAALVYFVMPLDALPDFIAILGLTDDVALLTWTWGVVKEEVERFLAWELEHESLKPHLINETNKTSP